MIEAVVSAVLLGTASMALMHLARSSADLQHRADRELSALLTAQNALVRLQSLSMDEIPEQLDSIQDSCARDSGCDVTIAVAPFNANPPNGTGVTGMHLRIEVASGDRVRVRLHDWRLVQASTASSGNAEESVSPDDTNESQSSEGAE